MRDGGFERCERRRSKKAKMLEKEGREQRVKESEKESLPFLFLLPVFIDFLSRHEQWFFLYSFYCSELRPLWWLCWWSSDLMFAKVMWFKGLHFHHHLPNQCHNNRLHWCFYCDEICRKNHVTWFLICFFAIQQYIVLVIGLPLIELE